MRLRFGDKLRRAAKMLDELQMDIANDVSDSRSGNELHAPSFVGSQGEMV